MMVQAMGRDSIHRDTFLRALYGCAEPEWAEGSLRVFLCHLRAKLTGLELSIYHIRPHQHGFVYEAREAA